MKEFEQWFDNETCGTATKAEKEIARRAWNAALESQWRPIEELPDDLLVFDLWTKHGCRHADCGRMGGDGYDNAFQDAYGRVLGATHFMIPPKLTPKP